MIELDHTHNPSATSWVHSANDGICDFPIQNLPFCIFRPINSNEKFRGGVAIGDQILDLAALSNSNHVDGVALEALWNCAQPKLNEFLKMGPSVWKVLRHKIFSLLSLSLKDSIRSEIAPLLIPINRAEFSLPVQIGNYTDFYTSFDHAMNIGKVFRPNDPLTPNFKWIPLAYHGRASSMVISGQKIFRPWGQSLHSNSKFPTFSPSLRLDYELELGIYIGQGNLQGKPIPLADAEKHIFGISLLNDWSARDIQTWESQPLGPFQSKNFASSLSPWIVTMEALMPYRTQWNRSQSEPQPLNYLEHPNNRKFGAIDIQLEVWIETETDRLANNSQSNLSKTSFKHQYWSIAQMVAHHTIGGCNLQVGDLLGSGTISGPGENEAGALVEISNGGEKLIHFNNNQQRSFLEDGDKITFKGYCDKDGFARIGFGEVSGEITKNPYL